MTCFLYRYLSVLVRRAKKWKSFIGSHTNLKKSLKTKRYTRKGIPGEHRSLVWMTMSGAMGRMHANPTVYQQLLDGPKNDVLVDVIRTDIHRTFPENIYFADAPEGKRQPLFNVLVAFAHHRQDIGYCQGLNFITGLFLLIVKEEEKSFWLLDALVGGIVPEGYYSPALLGLKTDTRVLLELLRVKCPGVFSKLENEGVSLELVTTKWFICCFVDVLPVETVLRIWDCLFYEGSKIIFRVAVTLVMKNREKFLAARNFAELLVVFKKVTDDKSNTFCHEFMEEIFKIPGSFPMSTIDKLRIQCEKQVVEEELPQST